jgi:hypothetical protein
MRTVRALIAALGPSALLLAGCLAPRPPAPPRPAAVRPPPPLTRCAPGTECAPKEPSPRRQYYDARHRRYYYFDPVKGAYFWEDGTPKL